MRNTDIVLIDCPGGCESPCEHRYTLADLARDAQERYPRDRKQAAGLVEAYLAGRSGVPPRPARRKVMTFHYDRWWVCGESPVGPEGEEMTLVREGGEDSAEDCDTSIAYVWERTDAPAIAAVPEMIALLQEAASGHRPVSIRAKAARLLRRIDEEINAHA